VRENWEAKKARMTDPKFVSRLHIKAWSYAFGPKDRVFFAIHYCRRWSRGKETVGEIVKKFPECSEPWSVEFLLREHCEYEDDVFVGPWNPEPKEFLGRELTDAVMRGDGSRLRDIAKLLESHEKPRVEKPWHYHVGKVASMLLGAGIVPTKKELKEAALLQRVFEECDGGEFTRSVFNSRLEDLARWRPKNWARIFRDLGLSDLPSARTRLEARRVLLASPTGECYQVDGTSASPSPGCCVRFVGHFLILRT